MATRRLQTVLRFINHGSASSSSQHRVCKSSILGCSTSTSCRRLSSTASVPVLDVRPKTSLSDQQLDIEVRGLEPGQLVTIAAQVYTECGRYKFQSSALYKACKHGQVSVRKDASLGGSYKGVEPLGLIWSLEPAPEVRDKYPKLVKFDVTEPFRYEFQLLVQEDELQGNPSRVVASTTVERRFLADYVEQIPLKVGRAEGILFLPKKRGSSDPLPVVLDIRGLLHRHVIDRAALLASHGFAVFAYNYFGPLVLTATEEVMYCDSMAFHDIVDFVSDHPRLDINRMGVTCSCYGGVIALNAASRLKLPIKCIAVAGFFDMLCLNVGWKRPDGTLIEPYGPIFKYFKRWKDDNGKFWIKSQNIENFEISEDDEQIPPVENIDCPMLWFRHGEDHHVVSSQRTIMLKERLDKAGRGHLIDYNFLPATGHFLEVPYQPKCPVSSVMVPTKTGIEVTPHYTPFGGEDARMVAREQEFAWRKIINFFRTHLKVTEMYRQDWISDYSPPS